MFGRIGFWEILLILLIVLIIIGPRKLPEMARALGTSFKEFRNATKQLSEPDNAPSKAEEPQKSS